MHKIWMSSSWKNLKYYNILLYYRWNWLRAYLDVNFCFGINFGVNNSGIKKKKHQLHEFVPSVRCLLKKKKLCQIFCFNFIGCEPVKAMGNFIYHLNNIYSTFQFHHANFLLTETYNNSSLKLTFQK